MKAREGFEALPEIAERIKSSNVWFNDYSQAYDGFGGAFANGAWYAFQEQEDKIKALEKELEMRKQGAMVMSHHRDEVLSICREYWCDDDRDYNIYIQRIEDILE